MDRPRALAKAAALSVDVEMDVDDEAPKRRRVESSTANRPFASRPPPISWTGDRPRFGTLSSSSRELAPPPESVQGVPYARPKFYNGVGPLPVRPLFAPIRGFEGQQHLGLALPPRPRAVLNPYVMPAVPVTNVTPVTHVMYVV